MSLNICLHCVNFLTFSAIVALIVHHQTVFLNAETNSTSAAVTARDSEENATTLLNFNTNGDGVQQKEKSKAITANQKYHLGNEKVNLSLNANDSGTLSSSVSPQKIAERKVLQANWGNYGANRSSNCTTAAHFGHKNSTKNEKTLKRKSRKADISSEIVEQISTEKENENGHSSESGEGEEKHSSDEAMDEGTARGTTTTANSSARDEAQTEVEKRKKEKAEENGKRGTNCGNRELLLMRENNETPTEEGSAEKGNGTEGEKETERTTNTAGKGHSKGRRRRRDSQDFVRQANAQLQNAFGNAQTMAQQQQQMPAQIIQIPSVDLSSGKAQNILLISDSGNVSMSRGLHFLTVSTVMQQ